MQERISNILAWFGFSLLAFYVLVLATSTIRGQRVSYINSMYIRPYIDFPFDLDFIPVIYGLCVVVSYLLVGRFRLLPWLKK